MPESKRPHVSVVLPCLNEEEAIGACLEKINRVFAQNNIDGEVIVCDNGSTDRSAEIARAHGATIVTEQRRGYGNAYITGFSAARGDYLVMGDADDTYDFNLIPQFLSKLTDEHYDFVSGSRYLAGGDEHITFLHRYLGNPALTLILNALFDCRFTDVYCGFRAFSRQAYEKIEPVSPGMEFNLELAINARLAQLRIAEIAIKLAPRKGKSKLNTFKDGWRSLRMMLVYSPNAVFMLPGVILAATGLAFHVALLMKLVQWAGRTASPISGIVALILTVVGFQILSLGLHAKTYSWSRRFDKHNEFLDRFYKIATLEVGLVCGILIALAGCGIFAWIFYEWLAHGMLPLQHAEWVPFAATMIIIGIQIMFTALFVSAMSMTDSRRRSTRQPLR